MSREKIEIFKGALNACISADKRDIELFLKYVSDIEAYIAKLEAERNEAVELFKISKRLLLEGRSNYTPRCSMDDDWEQGKRYFLDLAAKMGE